MQCTKYMRHSLLLLLLALSASQVLGEAQEPSEGVSDGSEFDPQASFLEVFFNATGLDETDLAKNIEEIVFLTFAEFADRLRSAIEWLINSMASVKNQVKRRALQSALAILQRNSEVAEQLDSSLTHLGDQLQGQIEQQRQHILQEWNKWADEQLGRVGEATNGEGTEQAEAIISELHNRYGHYLNSCVEALQEQITLFELQVQEAAESNLNATKLLLSEVERCLWSGNDLIASLSCRNRLESAAKPLRKAPEQLQRLLEESSQLLEHGLQASSCVANTLTDYELEKIIVEQKLDDIIDEYRTRTYPQQHETTTSL